MILNSSYEKPVSHWELDKVWPPTNIIVERRRRTDLITPNLKSKRTERRGDEHTEMALDAGDALSSLEQRYSDLSPPFPKPSMRRIAVKVINHLGDEVMTVVGV